MTSLAHQLKRLALPQHDSSLHTRREAVSLLFDPKEAARTDRGTFFALGCTGLEELMGIEPAFCEFQETLFSHASQTLERSVQSKEINKKLDKSISLFLTRLSPYFLLKPALKCVEWLLHRFHIHLYNPDCLIACVLPYHETNVFVRVIQLLKIDDPVHKWHWLNALKEAGVPLARGTLLTHCYKDLSFMDFICSMVTRSVKAYSECFRDGNCPQLRVIFSFYASTIVSTLAAVEKINEPIIAKLLPHVQMGLKSELLDYKASSYMIVCQMAVKVQMEASLLETLTLQLCKYLVRTPKLHREGLSAMIVLLQNQKGHLVGPRSFKYLSGVPSLVSTLKCISTTHDISPILYYLLPHLIHSAFSPDGELQTASSEPSERCVLLESVFQEFQLSSGLMNTAAELLLKKYMSCGEGCSSEHISDLNRRVRFAVQLFESRYPKALGLVLDSHVTKMSTAEEKNLLHQFISLTVSCGKYQILPESDTSLMLSLNHTLPAVRLVAVEHLKDLFSSRQSGFNQEFLREAMFQRIKDEVPEIVLSTLQTLQLNIDHLDAVDVVPCLISLLQRVSLSSDWIGVLKQVVRVLDDPRLTDGNLNMKDRISWELFSFLLVTKAEPGCAELEMAVCVAETALLSQHPLTHGWDTELKELLRKTSPSDVLRLVNQTLSTSLVRNMAEMNSTTIRNMLRNMCDHLKLQAGSVQKEAMFVLLTNTLLQSFQSVTESHQLHTAQSIYKLLEPLLLRVSTATYTQVSCDEAQARVPVCVALGSFLQKVGSGTSAEREYHFLLISLLRLFISTLKCQDPTLTDESWWNPENMDASTCCYLELLLRLFDLVTSGASEGPLAPCFKSVMQLLLQVHLNEPMFLFKFLSFVWSYNCNLGDQLDCRVSFVHQTRALYVGKALLSAQPIKTRNILASGSSPVFPSLLVCLCSSVCEVRRASIAVFQSLSGVVSSPYHALLEKLMERSDEMITDPAFLSQALSKVYDEAVLRKTKDKTLMSLEQLLHCVQSSCCPAYISKTLLRVLEHVRGEAILEALLPPIDRLLEQCIPDSSSFLPDEALLLQLLMSKYCEKSAPLLAKNPRSLDVFIRALGTTGKPYPTLPSFQIIALERITKAFFAAIEDVNVQQKILSVLFDLLVETKNPDCSQAIKSVFKTITVDGALVAIELMPAEKSRVAASLQQTRKSKRLQSHTQDVSGAVPPVDSVCWPRVTMILELLQYKKKLKNPQCLVPALFSLLTRCLEPEAADQENMEYTKQLLLACLLNICQKLAPAGKDLLEEDKFNVELVVQCVRTSNMPQTHHHALLLLGALAEIFPEKVLHNIMPIFTFMGASIMRLDDTYSFQVINKTVQAVIPALIKAHEEATEWSEGRVEMVVTRIMHVFVDALPHVPEHRRIPILAKLLAMLGPSNFLWILMLLLFKQHVTQTSFNTAKDEKEAVVERDQDFWISVCCEFEVKEQLTALIKILQFLKTLPQDSDEAPVKGKMKEETTSDLIFSVESHSGKDLRHFKFIAVSFMTQLLASDSFVGKVAGCVDVTESALQNLQQSLLEEVLRYIHVVARCVEDNSDKPTAKFWRALLSKTYDALDKVNALLPMDTFITVMKGLMVNTLPSVRRKAMELLNNKLQQRIKWQDDQIAALLDLIDNLLNIVGRSHGQIPSPEEAEVAINRQTALYSLKLLCRCFGPSHKEAFVPVLKKAVELVSCKTEEKNVTGSALLCAAEATATLKALAIPQIHRLMPAILDTLKERKDLMSSEVYLLSAVTALQKVSETLAHFISPYLQDTIMQVSRLTLVADKLASCPQLTGRLSSLSSTLATKVPSRVLLPALTGSYGLFLEEHQDRLNPVINLLKEHIAGMEKDTLNSHQSELTSFFMSALDFRAQHGQGDLKKTSEVEATVIECLLVMVMKLSEVPFRHLFFKLFDWSKMDGASKERLLTFYRLSDCIARKLKGLFLLFAGQLVKPVSELLLQINVAHTEEPFFNSEGEDNEDKVMKSRLLLQYILDCLQKIFLYDTQRFLSKERAEALLVPLVDQLENVAGGEEDYQSFITRHLVPCVGQFAVAMRDDSLWKVLNYQILLKTRHSSPKVRFSALLVLLELARKLKENYMVLLPETIPFLAELMEDECEDVEKQVQKVVQELETVLGESLQSYF